MQLVSEDEIRQQYPAAIQTLADGIPDSNFDLHPQIVELKAEEARIGEELRALASPLNAQLAQMRTLESLAQDLTEEHEKARIKFHAKSLGDFLRGDTAFSSALEEKATFQRLTWQLEAATAARLTLQCQIDEGTHRALVDRAAAQHAAAQHVLRITRLKLKLEAASRDQSLVKG